VDHEGVGQKIGEGRNILPPRLVLAYRAIRSGAQKGSSIGSSRLGSCRYFVYNYTYFDCQASNYDSGALFGNPPTNTCMCMYLMSLMSVCMSRDSSVGIVTSWTAVNGASLPDKDKRFFSSQRPHRLWGPPSCLSKCYQGLFPLG
jgi:hypothetical protein